MQEPAKERENLLGDILERAHLLSLIYCGKLLEAVIKCCFGIGVEPHAALNCF